MHSKNSTFVDRFSTFFEKRSASYSKKLNFHLNDLQSLSKKPRSYSKNFQSYSKKMRFLSKNFIFFEWDGKPTLTFTRAAMGAVPRLVQHPGATER